jgi:hypothetical protein
MVEGGLGMLSDVSWSSDGTEALLCSEDGVVYSYTDGGPVEAIPSPPMPPLFSVAWDPSGTRALIAGAETTLRIYIRGVMTLEPVTNLPDSIAPQTMFTSIVTADDDRVVIVGTERTVLPRDGWEPGAPFRDMTLHDAAALPSQPPWHAAASTPDLTLLCGEGTCTAFMDNRFVMLRSTEIDLRVENLTAAAATSSGEVGGGIPVGAAPTEARVGESGREL